MTQPNIDDIIDDELRREGGFSNDPADAGGRTNFGISEKANPEAWKDGKVTSDEARAIFLKKYVEAPGFTSISDANLLHQMVDFGVLSGPAIAIKKLQKILGVEEDGVMGPNTLSALSKADPRLTNNKLVVARAMMLAQICKKVPSQVKFLEGWLDRALSFLL